jgi:hypothetical protein
VFSLWGILCLDFCFVFIFYYWYYLLGGWVGRGAHVRQLVIVISGEFDAGWSSAATLYLLLVHVQVGA